MALNIRQLLLCALASVLILGAGFIAITNARDSRSAIGSVQRTFRVMLAVDQVRSALIDAETGQRGYLLTAERSYLAPYEDGLRRVIPALAELHSLVGRDPAAQERFARLDGLVETKLDEMALTIERFQSEVPDSALAIVRNDIGKRTMDEIRGLLDGMRGVEDRMLGERLALRDERVQQTLVSTVALTLASLLIFTVVLAGLNQTLIRRAAAERAVVESEERLRVTLRSIGDAVIATDLAGCVVFLNPIAQALTGWRESEAIGVPLTQVFCIVNEQTRDVVESPVAKVLRESTVVGLANHTMLLSRDGSEHPIDDSGAPIRDAEGIVMGVVLVFRDVTARRRAEQESADLRRMRIERDSAEAANRAKDEFLAVVSHELRSPLAAAAGWIEVLASEPLTAADRSRAIETIGRNLRLQSLLISDLLDVSRIVAGTLAIEPVPVNVAATVEAVVADYRHTAEACKLDLRLECGTGYVALLDRARFEQVLSNLLSNAIRFTPEGGRITVTLGIASDGMIEVGVRDTGHGIESRLLPYVFDRFWQAQRATRRDHGGLGLGLAIAKYLIEQHGGTIAAESEGTGRGATFRLRLRAYQGPLALRESRGPSAGRGRLDGVSVLLVEDDPDTRDALEHLMRNRGAVVEIAGSAQEGFAILQASRPRVVVSDLGLGRESGIDLVRRIRAAEEGSAERTAAIAVSGFVGSEDRREALAAGFDAHLPKPLDFSALIEVIRQLIEAPAPGL